MSEPTTDGRWDLFTDESLDELERMRAIHGDNYGRCKVEPMPATTAGRWTTEPPTVPDWYWWRQSDKYPANPVKIFSESVPGQVDVYSTLHRKIVDIKELGGEWHTTPIQKPPR